MFFFCYGVTNGIRAGLIISTAHGSGVYSVLVDRGRGPVSLWW
jgi:hypothetical protein